ncbi:MAG: division/cell wall cluster transcriptional repressor MraZ [Deltaproteobacteria bacterium]|nr:division/cell wall cluster transcriptional repressor MraZ [Deltaproteobacteria bacterium]
MFRGRFEHSIDSKGRLSIPSRFRETLAERYDARLVVTAYDNLLLAYPFAEWQRLEDKVRELAEFKKDTRSFLRFFYSSAVDCAIDKLGRVLIPPTLREYARLEKDVVLIGTLRNIEIWNKADWEKARSGVSVEEIASTLDRLNI